MDAAGYHAWYGTPRGAWVGHTELRLLLDLLRPEAGASLLDLGCGSCWSSGPCPSPYRPRASRDDDHHLTALKTHMDAAAEEGTGLQDAIEALDQSPWQGLADFEALSGRNAHQTYLEREAAAFE